MKKLSTGAYILISIMVVMLASIAELLRFESFATKVMPIAVSSSVFVLAAMQLWQEIRGKGSAKPGVADDESNIEEENKAEGRQYLPIAAWLVGFALAIYIIGFYVASLLLILFYMRQNGSRWPSAIILAVLSTAILYSVFELALRTDLHQGLLSLLF